MTDLLLSFVFIILLAWLGRALVGARELGWGRLILAAIAGIAFGDSIALFLVTADLGEVANLDIAQHQLVAMPFRVIGTMGAIVVLELVFRRSRTRGSALGSGSTPPFRPASILSPRVLLRALQVSRILTRHGFAWLFTRHGGGVQDAGDLARRARQAFEEAGGVFIKLGQLVATRPDLLPPAAIIELARLQSGVSPLDSATARAELEAQLGQPSAGVFSSIEWDPLGSASIAQAHSAVLLDGSRVVIKLRRPGLEKVMRRDLSIISWLARSAELRFDWASRIGVTRLAAEFATTLLQELDFRTEARNIAEIEQAASSEPLIAVPQLCADLTGAGIIVMQHLAGTPLSAAGQQESEDLADALCRSQVRAMLDGDRFHGDPHPGNLMLLEDGRLGLIDLGVSSRLDAFERSAVFQMLVALQEQQPALLYESMLTIGTVDPAVHDRGEIERALARFMAAYLGPGLPPALAITDLLRLTLRLGLRLPPSTSAMFRALSTLMGSLEQLSPGYPVIDRIAELGGAEFRRRLMPGSAAEFVRQEWSELGPLLARLPRHVDKLATMLQHGTITTSARVLADPDDRSFIERLANRFILTLLSVGVGAVSVMLLNVPGGFELPWIGVGLYEVLGWIGLFIAMTLMFRVLLGVLED